MEVEARSLAIYHEPPPPPQSDDVLRGQKVFLILYLDGTQLGIPLAVG